LIKKYFLLECFPRRDEQRGKETLG